MKSRFFVFLLFIFHMKTGHTQPGNIEVCEVLIEYSSFASNLDSLNARYQITGGHRGGAENDSLMYPSSSISYYSTDVLIKISDSLQIVKEPFLSNTGSIHIFLPMFFNQSDKSTTISYQYTVKIIEKRSGAEMIISLIGKKDDFFSYDAPFLEITNMSFAKGFYLINLNDEASSGIPSKYHVTKIDKRASKGVLYRSCAISDLSIHAISKRKMKQIQKNNPK